MATVEIRIPDIGTEDDVDVIEVLVKPGDFVNLEDPLLTLESDKATMDVPASVEGTVDTIAVGAGDKVREGSVVMTLSTSAGAAPSSQSAPASEAPTAAPAADPVPAPKAAPEPVAARSDAAAGTDGSQTITVTVPDIGTEDAVDVIEIHVAVGDIVAVDDPLITLESDKASMDVPAPHTGTVTALMVGAGDTTTSGSAIAELSVSGQAPVSAPATDPAQPAASPTPPAAASAEANQPANAATTVSGAATTEVPRVPSTAPPPPPVRRDENSPNPADLPHASPSIRRFARELGADLRAITGTGRKGRILREDVQQWVKQQLSGAASGTSAGSGAGIPPVPAVDFSKFGDIETVKLSRIKRISGPFLQRSWLNVPHVTHHDEADITEMDAFRRSLKADAEAKGVKLTPLVFAMKALVATLREFPQFNASLSPDGESLILKKYFHIGIAVDTPDGLVVPVIRDVDRKGLFDLSAELADVSSRAREGKLKANELQGGCISISSLGGIGGTAFTPIVNAPEVAILGLARSKMMPVWNGTEFTPRLMQPLDLSYDHRAVDGAEAARFTVALRDTLGDIRRLVL